MTSTRRVRTISSAVAACLFAAVALLFVGGHRASADTPPWAPGGVSQDPNAVGGLVFFDSTGHQITSGSTTVKPFAAYVVGQVPTRTVAWTDTTATLYAYLPTVGQNPGAWQTSEQLGGSPTFPNAAAPAPINSTTLPVYTGSSTFDETLDSLVSDIPQTATTTGYVNTYEMRIYTNAAFHSASTTYVYADITIDSVAHTWSLVYTPAGDFPPASATTTTTSVSASPTSAHTGDTVTLSATVSPAGAAGTVQFKDGSTAIGSPVTVSAGAASTTTTFSSTGSHSITAVFTPSNSAAFTASTSSATTVTITAPTVTTTTSVSASPASVETGASVALSATVSPSTALGSVQFKDGSTNIGAAVAVSGGTAGTTTSFSSAGSHSITAVFTPTVATAFTASTSTATTVTVTTPPPTATTTTTAVTATPTSVSTGDSARCRRR